MAWIQRHAATLVMAFAATILLNIEWGALQASAPAEFRQMALLVGTLVLAWLLIRRRVGAVWAQTALDWAAPVWLIALCGSTLINIGNIRVSLLAVWYWGLLALVWIVCADLLSNRLLKRWQLANAILIGAALPMAAALLQLVTALLDPARESGLFGLARVGGTLRNPSMFGTLMFVVLGLAAARMFSAGGRAGRIGFGLLSGLAAALLVLTFSRGAWLGGAAVLLVLGGLSLLRAGGAGCWWAGLSAGRRRAALLVGAAALILAAVFGGLLLDSLNLSGRGVDSRTYIWSAALDAFSTSPLFGHGPMSFSTELAARISLPPVRGHNHAHNLMLHVLAELGAAGGLALVVSGILIVRAGWRALNHPALPAVERPLVRAALAVTAGFAVQSMVDVTGFQLSVAVTQVWVLLLLTVSPEPGRRTRIAQRVMPLLAGGLTAALVAVQIWSTLISADYVRALEAIRLGGGLMPNAALLETVVARDPAMPSYRWALALVYAEQARTSGDLLARERSVELLGGLPDLGADTAMVWANLGALRLEQGDFAGASAAYEQALERAAESPALAAALGLRAERAGQNDLARAMFAHLLTLPEAADWALHPGIRASAVFAGLPQPVAEDGSRAQLVGRLLAGDAAGALERGLIDTPRRADNYAILALAAHQIDDARAADLLAQAAVLTVEPVGEQWLALARFVIDGVAIPVPETPPNTVSLLWAEDFPTGVQFWYATYFRPIPWRVFVPELGYSQRDPLLAALSE